jgi:hypothetical protein
MMQAFKKVQKHEGKLIEDKACGFYVDGSGERKKGHEHNEAILDSRTWVERLKTRLWAFVLTDACTGACETVLRSLHKQYTAKYGHISIIRFNRKDSKNPFSASSQASETAATTNTDEDEAATSMSILVGQASNMSSVFV